MGQAGTPREDHAGERGAAKRAVLTDAEWQQYIAECPQPWRDAAIIIRGTGMRPGEVFALRWENIYLNGSGGLIQVTEGKTKAARRMLPMVPAVYGALKAGTRNRGSPKRAGYSPASREGHFNKDTAKDQHKKPSTSEREGEEGGDAGTEAPFNPTSSGTLH